MRHEALAGRFALCIATLCLLFVVGCQSSDKSDAAEGSDVSMGALAVCNGCGYAKGTAKCCADGQVTCTGCGFSKGSIACCVVEKGDEVYVCVKCGQFKGTSACCDPYATKCAGCGLAKGSPACCKLDG